MHARHAPVRMQASERLMVRPVPRGLRKGVQAGEQASVVAAKEVETRMKLIRCYACREFFGKDHRECPACMAPRRPLNVALASQGWRSNLNAQANRAADPRQEVHELGRHFAGG